MNSLIVQFLASIIVFVSLSFTQEDGEGRRGRPIKETIRFGGRSGEEQRSIGSSLPTDASNSASFQKKFKVDNNTGTAVVCGPKDAQLNVSWTPKVIDPDKSVELYFNITNPINFDKGQADVDVYMEGSSDPIFSVVQEIACDDIRKAISFVTCPLKKGDTHAFKYKYGDLNRLPVGAYIIVLKILSYEGNPHPLFACLNFTLHIVPSDQVLFNPDP